MTMINEKYYLSHGGPGSGRYPLGSGERPYQKFEKSSGRSRSSSRYTSSKKYRKRIELEIKKKQKQEELMADKERVLRSGKASEVLRYKGTLTNKELQDVYQRLNLEKQIEKLSTTEFVERQQIVDRVLGNVTRTTGWIATGAAAYNTLASIYNSVADESKKLPVLSLTKSK